MNKQKIVILGAGVSGLAAGMKLQTPIYEASSHPGGLCHSYKKNGYYFEKGGSHWIFGDASQTLPYIEKLVPLNSYQRKAAIFFPKNEMFVPYPIQNHLSYFPKKVVDKIVNEVKTPPSTPLTSKTTLSEWLEYNFGKSFCCFFFFPFHELYTAGLYSKIAPQDSYKIPVNKEALIDGAFNKKNKPLVGYNTQFYYPKGGIGSLIKAMSNQCQINYKHLAIKIDTDKKIITFKNGLKIKFEKIYSSIPLTEMLKIANISIDEPECPNTSTFIVHIGAKRGKKFPSHHWIYTPESKTGFYRMVLYSNIDPLFLPKSSLKKDNVCFYAEKSFLGGQKPKLKEIKLLMNEIVNELKDWQFIEDIEVIDYSWVNTAYTWSWPNSNWREKALAKLEEKNIYQIGRYGRWKFMGILECIKEGLLLT